MLLQTCSDDHDGCSRRKLLPPPWTTAHAANCESAAVRTIAALKNLPELKGFLPCCSGLRVRALTFPCSRDTELPEPQAYLFRTTPWLSVNGRDRHRHYIIAPQKISKLGSYIRGYEMHIPTCSFRADFALVTHNFISEPFTPKSHGQNRSPREQGPNVGASIITNTNFGGDFLLYFFYWGPKPYSTYNI